MSKEKKKGFDNKGAEFDDDTTTGSEATEDEVTSSVTSSEDEEGTSEDEEKKVPVKKKKKRKKPKYGVPRQYDPNFDGPTDKRSCTDIPCCLFFTLFCFGIVALGGYAYYSGEPLTLIYATDYKGNVCGLSQGFENRPFLFYFDLLECVTTATIIEANCPSTKICLSKCPKDTYAPYTLLLLSKFDKITVNGESFFDLADEDWERMYCRYDFDAKMEYNNPQSKYYHNLHRIFDENRCARYNLKSEVLYERCVPAFLVSNDSSVSEIFEEITGAVSIGGDMNYTTSDLEKAFQGAVNILLDVGSFFDALYEDFLAAWWIILMGLAAGMLLSLIWIFLMRWIAPVMIWGSIFVLYGVLGIGIWFCFRRYIDLQNMKTSDETFAFIATISNFLREENTWLAFGITLLVIFLILLLVTLCLCNRVRIAVQLIAESSKAIGSMMSSLFFPILPFFMQVVIFSMWTIIAVYLATSHEARYEVYNAPPDFLLANGTECDEKTFNQTHNVNATTASCVFVSYGLPFYTIYLQFGNLFGLFWISNFFIALTQITLSGAFASYFWAHDKTSDLPDLPVARSFWWAIRYHLGTIAFGALILAIIKLIRYVIDYVQVRLKGTQNQFARYMLECIKCFFCFKFLKFLNKNAYIETAIYGTNFCTSAQHAFFLLMRNILRVTVVNKITNFLLFLGTMCIVSSITVGLFFYFSVQINFVHDLLPVPEIKYYWIVILVIALGVFAIARGFFSVFDMAVDTMFLSFLEDLERHDGSPEKPYYMSRSLMGIVGKKNKKPKRKPVESDEEYY